MIDETKIKKIIDDLISTNDNFQSIADRYGVSSSSIEKINECKSYKNLHSYEKNIRKESNGLNLRVFNEYIEKDNYYILKIIRLDNQQVNTMIDKEDYEKIKKYTWSFKIDSNNNYRIHSTSSSPIELSTWLLNGNMKEVVDHIDRNTLNNRKNNLRLTSRSINSTNAKARKESKTNIRGVYKRKAREGVTKESWICEWSINGKRYSKSFSCKKYGEEKAFELAYSLRKEKEKEMKI